MSDDGTIGLGNRFERMEGTLARIEAKLDTKVDVTDFARLERRLEAIEGGTTPLGQWFLREYESVKSRLGELENKGSRNAREAEELAHALEIKVNELSADHERRSAIVQNTAAREVKGYQRWMLMLGFVAGGSALFNVLQVVGVI